ncbi:MAG: DUF4147 domain-containing protein [Candidatus Heimdallarchaeota archaeon]|nr:DUF4147 domain-containing protein [Candidatus Heimdallarchaeota archaeon]MDH5645502.1 DUF4147 domain-containing protein [Candidatus Heimdallarchaeota archaeon]
MTTVSYKLSEELSKEMRNLIELHISSLVTSINSIKPHRSVLNIPNEDLNHEKQIILSFGKNAAVFADALQNYMQKKPQKIYVLQAKYYSNLNKEKLSNWFYYELPHPIPTETTFKITEKLCKELDKLDENTVFQVIITGGTSAVLAIPENGITAKQYIEIVTSALKQGFDIHELNTIRALIDRVKAGKFSSKYSKHKIYTWCISDVISDNPQVIGSGPTVPGIIYSNRAVQWLNRYVEKNKLQININSTNDIKQFTTTSGDTHCEIILSRKVLLSRLDQHLQNNNINSRIINMSLGGNIEVVCDAIVEEIIKADNYSTLIWAGEPVVVLNQTINDNSKGGRVSSICTLVAEKIKQLDNICFIGIATDGKDGTSPSSGYIVSNHTAKHLIPLGGSYKIIQKLNTGGVLSSLGYGLTLNQTDINLLDIYMAIIL